jgi:hypothetical protein
MRGFSSAQVTTHVSRTELCSPADTMRSLFDVHLPYFSCAPFDVEKKKKLLVCCARGDGAGANDLRMAHQPQLPCTCDICTDNLRGQTTNVLMFNDKAHQRIAPVFTVIDERYAQSFNFFSLLFVVSTNCTVNT